MTHHIQRQYLQVDVEGTESEGFAIQNRLSDLCAQWLNPAIERVMDRVAPADRHLRIERLEVDAGTLSPEHFEQEFVESVARALETLLREQISQRSPTAATSDTGSSDTVLHSGARVAADALLYFLEKGRLPWSLRLPPGVSFEAFLLETRGFDSGSASFNQSADAWSRSALARTLAYPQARKRLVLQFSKPFLQALLQWIAPGYRHLAGRIPEIGRATAVAAPSFENHLWETALRLAVQPAPASEITSDAALVGLALATHPEAIVVVFPALKTLLSAAVLPELVRVFAAHSGPSFSAYIPLLERQLKTIIDPLPVEIQSLLKIASHPKNSRQAQSRKSGAGVFATETAATAQQHEPGTAAGLPEEAIYVDNAGLIILHPFLQLFFEGLGIARDGALIQPGQALQLLHFLCTGHTPAPEYELTLPKILCNIPPETPVEPGEALSDREKAEAENLLRAAIRWWEALRDTSPDGLRGTFLCRPGKLSLRDDGDWLLQVERQSFDVLLDQLPWGISAVKLPWMEGVVWVEWG